MDRLVVIAVDVVLGLLVVIAVVFVLRGCTNLVQAPAKLESALGDNKAFAAGAGKQNAAVDAMANASKNRKAVSEAAVAAAGKKEAAEAAKILATPAKGDTPLERAANRINAEFAP